MLGVLLCAAFLGACGGTDSNTPRNPETLVLADAFGIDSLDPAYAYDSASIGQIANIYETLVKYDGASTDDIVPLLATEWTVSDDGRTYRFRIRSGVNFHNGAALDPEDVEYSFERGMVQDYGAGPQWMIFEPLLGVAGSRQTDGTLVPLDDIKNAVEVDSDWVQFNLVEPYSPFLEVLTGTWSSIVDREWCVEQGDWDGSQESYESLNNPTPQGSPLQRLANGTGPFKLDLWQPGLAIALVRNDDYWGKPANFKTVVTKFVDEWATRKLMLDSGDADYAFVPSSLISEVRGQRGLTVYEDLSQLQNQALFFQFDISRESTYVGTGKLDGNGVPLDFFTDIDVRKGFAYAFDWDTYIEEGLLGQGRRIASPIVEGVPYYDPEWQMYEFDLVKAEEHLKTAWNGQLWEKGFTLTVPYASGDLGGKIACQVLQDSMFGLNPKFKISIQLKSWPALLSEMKLGLIPLLPMGWTADYPDAHNFVFPYMHSEGTFAQSQHYHNSDVDRLVGEGIASSSPTVRQAVYDELAGLYYSEVPSIILAQNLGAFVFRDWVHGFEYNPMRPSCAMYAYDLSKQA